VTSPGGYRSIGAPSGTSLPWTAAQTIEPDPDTPYPGAQRTAKLLGDAELLTLDTFGHGALDHSQCIDEAVDAYFIGGRMPAANTACEQNHGPFD